jgi:ankyrin repeat protein
VFVCFFWFFLEREVALAALLADLDTASAVDDVALCNAALHDAAQSGHAAVVKALLALGASPAGVASRETRVASPLVLACRGGHVETAALLLEAGANPNQNDAKSEAPFFYSC